MKKILMGSVVLTALSLSIIAFQMSCSKSANAQTSGTTSLTQLNLVLYSKDIPYNANGGTNRSFWTSNLDGSNQKQIPISGIPENELESANLTPDGKTVVFEVSDSITNKTVLYSCSIDGTNLKKIVGLNSNESTIRLQGTY